MHKPQVPGWCTAKAQQTLMDTICLSSPWTSAPETGTMAAEGLLRQFHWILAPGKKGTTEIRSSLYLPFAHSVTEGQTGPSLSENIREEAVSMEIQLSATRWGEVVAQSRGRGIQPLALSGPHSSEGRPTDNRPKTKSVHYLLTSIRGAKAAWDRPCPLFPAELVD